MLKSHATLNLWFGNTSKQAFPLIALQYNELVIHVRIRPIQELFTIRDVKDKNVPAIWNSCQQ